MDSCIVQRIKEIMDFYKLNQTSFSKRVGLKQSNLSKILSGERTCGDAVINKISMSFDIRKEWLLSGEGEMLKPVQSVGDITNSNVSGVNVNGKEIHINPDAYQTLLKIVESNQKTTEKFQEQIDRLISVIEKKYDSENR